MLLCAAKYNFILWCCLTCFKHLILQTFLKISHFYFFHLMERVHVSICTFVAHMCHSTCKKVWRQLTGSYFPPSTMWDLEMELSGLAESIFAHWATSTTHFSHLWMHCIYWFCLFIYFYSLYFKTLFLFYYVCNSGWLQTCNPSLLHPPSWWDYSFVP
jgi:hypothetical protein